jgi:hypothetical protein
MRRSGAAIDLNKTQAMQAESVLRARLTADGCRLTALAGNIRLE